MHLRDLLMIAGDLKKSKVDVIPIPSLNVLSVFDDIFFENYDYDIISPKRRMQLAKELEKSGFEQTSGRVFEKNGTRIGFTKPNANLSGSLLYDIEESLENLDAIFLTPTRTIAWGIHSTKNSNKRSKMQDEIMGLLKEHPANIEKLRDFAREEGENEWYAAFRSDMLEARKIGVERKKFKR